MDCDEADFDMQIEEELYWAAHGEEAAFDMSPEEDTGVASSADTEFYPATDAEHPVDTVVHHGPVDPVVQSELSPLNAVEPVAPAETTPPSTQARSDRVVVPEARRCRLLGKQRAPAPKRRRLHGKQRVPAASMSAVYCMHPNASKAWASCPAGVFNKLQPRTKYFKVYNKCRWWLSKQPFAKGPASAQDEPAHVVLLRHANTHLQNLTAKEKHSVFQSFLSDTSAPQHIVAFAQAQWTEQKGDCSWWFLLARTVILTWNGDWGLFTGTGLAPGTGWRVVVAFLQSHPPFVALWTEFKAHCERLSDLLGAVKHAFSMELCVKTWEQDGEVRVHGHLYLNAERNRMSCARAQLASFKDSRPHKSHKVAALNNRACSGFAGCYYLLAPTVGLIRNESNVRPYKDFGVRPEWITNMVRAEKVECSDALIEMTQCGKGLQRRSAEFKAWEAAKKKIVLQARVDLNRPHGLLAAWHWPVPAVRATSTAGGHQAAGVHPAACLELGGAERLLSGAACNEPVALRSSF